MGIEALFTDVRQRAVDHHAAFELLGVRSAVLECLGGWRVMIPDNTDDTTRRNAHILAWHNPTPAWERFVDRLSEDLYPTS